MTTSGKPSPEPQEATPADELRQQIMNPNIPKNEREWWAAHEIERLAALAQPDAEVTPSARSLGLAAQAWCEPETSHKIMDEELATAFARILDRVLAQSDAGPVAWRYRIKDITERHPWQFTMSIDHAAKHMKNPTYECERLYTAAPRPDVSGLIETEVSEAEYQAASDAYDAYEEPEPKALKAALAAAKTYARQIDRRWAGVYGELIPDCPTEGVAARQGNGG